MVQKRTTRFAQNANGPGWEILASRRKLSHICALFKVYNRYRAWKTILDRIKIAHYLSTADHRWKIRSMKQRTDIAKYSFVNRTIQLWNKLAEEVIGDSPVKKNLLRKGQGKR
jgi:hypothetical protein